MRRAVGFISLSDQVLASIDRRDGRAFWRKSSSPPDCICRMAAWTWFDDELPRDWECIDHARFAIMTAIC
jgi:hypothetical protein